MINEESEYSNKLYSVDYYVKEQLTRKELEDLELVLVNNNYRAVVADISFIEIFRDIPILKVGMVNYDSVRYNMNEIKNMFKINPYIVEEIEFIFPKKYMGYTSKFWRGLINDKASDGVRVRPMIDLYEYSDKEIIFLVEFLRKIGINTLGVSTGTETQLVNLQYLEKKKTFFPNKWDIKILGINSETILREFLKSDTADICGTSTLFDI
jgi:hypothetical protein